MKDTLQPETSEQVQEAVAWAVSEDMPLEVLGNGSKKTLGGPVQGAYRLDLSALSGITLYEPEELILSARAATPLSEISAALEGGRQELAFEPADLGPLLGREEGGGTLGGIISCNLSGPRRLKAGAARDHFLGVKAVSGRGEAFKSGGRVVKNVTGYDMCKVLAGSWGTLAVMTDVTVKVLPKAETEATVVIAGLGQGEALTAMSRAMGSAFDVSAAAHIPGGIVARAGDAAYKGIGLAMTVLRVEGFEGSVKYRCEKLVGIVGEFGKTEILDADTSQVLWRDVRDVRYFADGSENPVWKLSLTPMASANIIARIGDEIPLEVYYDWAGGLVWISTDDESEADAEVIRAIVDEHGGHATLVRAPMATRSAVGTFHPQSSGVAALAQRLKSNFDPSGILNPGRMSTGL